jgi:hypothetical protein
MTPAATPMTEMAVITEIFRALGADISPERHVSMIDTLGSVVFAPAMESLLLAVALSVLLSFSSSRILVAVASATVWGCFPALFGALWFFGTAWSFFIFSCAYRAWRERGFAQAYTAAVVPHALINLSVFLALAVKGT